MNLKDAAAKVLAEVGEPQHYRELTQKILQRGIWHTQGKTPWDTLNAQLSVDIRNKGESSRFQRTSRGVFALRSWELPEFTPKSKARRRQQPGSRPAQRSSHTTQPRTLTFADAAESILQDLAQREPMHYRVITDKILELDLVQTEGETPAATLYSAMLQEIKRQKKQGELPRFVNHEKGFFGLSQWLPTGVALQITRHNSDVRSKLLHRLRKMAWDDFEELIGRLLVTMGFEEVEVTPSGGDGGIDVRGTLVVGDVIRTEMAIQVKRWKNNVQKPTVQQVRGSLGAHEQGLIITTSDFSAGARTEAARPDATPVALMNGKQLVNVLIDYDIGIQRTSYDLIELQEEEKARESDSIEI